MRLPEKITALVVVPHHRGRLIDRCLETIQSSDLGPYSVKTITVSSDPDYPATIYSTTGPAEKRNLAVKFYGSTHKYLIFLDDDLELGRYTLWNMIQAMEAKPQCGMGFTKILNMERRQEFDDCGSWLTWTGFLWARAGNAVLDVGQFDAPEKVLASKSACCIVRRDAFLEAGGFDDDYYILGEETDLAWRIWLTGRECWYFPSAVSWHAFNTGLKPKDQYYTDERVFYRGCRNYLNLLLTNLGTTTLVATLPIHLSGWLVSAAGFVLTGHPRKALMIVSGIISVVRTIKPTLRKRKKVQGNRKLSDRQLLPLISRNPGWAYYAGRLKRYWTQQTHG